MRKRLAVAALLLFAASFCMALGTKDAGDTRGRTERVVALSRSVADMWLLAGGSLAGVTDDAFDLERLTPGAVSIGTLTKPSLEAIAGLSPGLVLSTEDIPAHKALRASLSGMGIACLVVDVKCFADYKNYMKEFTGMTGRPDLFRRAVTDVEHEISLVKESVPRGDNGTFLLMRVSPSKNKVLKEHFALEIIRDMGLSSVTDDDALLDDISMEAILALNPTYIFVTSQGDDARAMETFRRVFEEQPAWHRLDAVRSGKVIVLPRAMFNYKPDAEWADAYRFVFGAVFPGLG